VLIKVLYIKFLRKPKSGSRADTRGQRDWRTDRYFEHNKIFSWLCERT